MLSGKITLVTGGSRGIGRAIVLAAAKNGSNVAIVYNGNETAANQTADEARAFGVSAKIYKCNVADYEAVKGMTAQALNDFGGVDILINNAGIIRDALMIGMKEEDYDIVMDTNLKGSFNTIRHLYQNFMRKRAGRIINISSVSGLMGNPGQSNYSAAKAGLIGLTKTVAKELAGRGITCNAIAPGYIQTDMTGSMNSETIDKLKEYIPLKRLGITDDIASLAVFLASDSAGYITGEVIKVDGGLYI